MAKLVIKENRFTFLGTVLRLLILAAIVTAVIYVWGIVVLQNRVILHSVDLPKEFAGYKIAHISDLLNSNLSYEGVIDKFDPNMVVITGNIADAKGKYSTSVNKIKKLTNNYTVLFIDGALDTEEVIAAVQESGAIYVQGGHYEIKVRDDAPSLKILGISESEANPEEAKQSTIEALGILNNADYDIALINRTEMVPQMSGNGLDLILSGNTLGVDYFANGRVGGVYSDNDSRLIVSPGIGKDNGIITRNLARPAVTCIKLTDVYEKEKNPIEQLLGLIIKDTGTIFDGQPAPELSRQTFVNGREQGAEEEEEFTEKH
jgi:predicted MPP superfamily phosphohydrolase